MTMQNIRGSLRGSTALRGIVRARADADPAAEALELVKGVKTLIEGQGRTFEAFKAANDERLKAIEKGRGDVLSEEKVDKINADLTKFGAELDGMNAKLAAISVNGAGADVAETVEQKKYSAAYGTYFRKGDEKALQAIGVNAVATGAAGSDPDGGWTVPIQIETTIDRVLAKVSAMRRIASVRTISSAVYRKPFNIAGTDTGWVGETDPRAQTNTSKLSVLDFPAMELYAMPAATQALLDDSSIDIAQWLADEVGIVFAEQEGTAFITGDGNAKPMGVLAYPTVADASYAWGKLGYVASGAAADFPASDQPDVLIDVAYALKQGYRPNASWLMNRKTQAAIRKFKDGEGDYVWQMGMQSGQPATIFGYPVVDDDNMQDIGANNYPVAFGDFARGYLIVDRIGIRTLRDPFTSKPYVLFYTTKRVGGGVQNFEAIKLLKMAAS